MTAETSSCEQLLARIRIVLVETSHPGNIGAAARAMKTQNLGALWLVSPRQFPCAEATVRASGADDLLARATVVDSLEAAIAGCGAVYGTSARSRSLEWQTFAPWEMAQRILAGADEDPPEAARGEVAVVFGRENSGLSNEELQLCRARVSVPVNPGYGSLNLAAAVQVIAYELNSFAHRHGNAAAIAERVDRGGGDPLATGEELAGLLDALREFATGIGYFDPAKPKQLIRRLHRLLNRAALSHSEVQILRGLLAAAERRLADSR